MARKIVITGGPGSGKSSVISSIEHRGYHVEYEIGREVLDELRQKGYENPHKKNRDAFQREVLRRQLEREERLGGIEETVFFDRGIVDNLAYYLLDSIEPPDFLERLARDARYNYIFYLELISQDKLLGRNLDDKERTHLGRLLLKEYARLGYNIVKIPELPLEERTDMILKEVGL